MNQSYSILINTCDKFEDCWDPFFKLFIEYWPDYNGKIYLNTEYKDFSYKNLNIIPIKCCIEKQDRGKITWSECLIRAINFIDEEVILYMQEDYFLKDYVKNDIVLKYVSLMVKNTDIDCIHLTDQAVPNDILSDKYEKLWSIPIKNKDRISCQAALWRKNILLQYLRPYETAWNFEWWGSKRAAILKHNFYVVDKSWVKLGSFEIIPYIFTGVIGGRWFKDVVTLFKRHAIEMDYTKRGFYEEKKTAYKKLILSKIKRLPVDIRSQINIFFMKISNKK